MDAPERWIALFCFERPGAEPFFDCAQEEAKSGLEQFSENCSLVIYGRAGNPSPVAAGVGCESCPLPFRLHNS